MAPYTRSEARRQGRVLRSAVFLREQEGEDQAGLGNATKRRDDKAAAEALADEARQRSVVWAATAGVVLLLWLAAFCGGCGGLGWLC